MNQAELTKIEPPRIEHGRAMLLAGISETCDQQSSSRIRSMWQRFVPHIGSIPGQSGPTAYGVLSSATENGETDYLCAVEVSTLANLPPGFAILTIPASVYAVFTLCDHISAIRETWHAIWSQWPAELDPAGTPEFERYGESSNGHTGLGCLEIWIPVNIHK